MPTPKKWFPLSRDINSDPEVWELEKQFGQYALRFWIEILARADENDNVLKIDKSWIRMVSRKTKLSVYKVVEALVWMVDRGWVKFSSENHEDMSNDFITIAEIFLNSCTKHGRGLANGSTMIDQTFHIDSPIILSTAKYWKYHRRKEPTILAVAPSPSYP